MPSSFFDDDTPAELLPHLDSYWTLTHCGHAAYIPRALAEELSDWRDKGTAGSTLVWPNAAAHGITPKMAHRGVRAALARRGRRYRFAITPHENGTDYIVTKRRGLLPLPTPLARELHEINSLLREAENVGDVLSLRDMREQVLARTRQPLQYLHHGRRHSASTYGFHDWPAGTWRVFNASCTSARIRACFESFCKTRGLQGHLEVLRLVDGRLCVLRTGQTERPWPTKPVDDVDAAPSVMVQADRQAVWLPVTGHDPLMGSSYVGLERIAALPHRGPKPAHQDTQHDA